MNDILVLIEIIKQYGGKASLEEISSSLSKKYKMLVSPSFYKTLEEVLNNSDYVEYDGDKYVLVGDGDSKNAHNRKLDRSYSNNSDYKSRINILYKNNFSNISNVNYNEGKWIKCNGIEIHSRSDHFLLCFQRKLIKQQKQLDYLTDTYKDNVYVHYGKNYQNIGDLNVSRCIPENEKDKDTNKIYFSLDFIDENDVLDVYEYLMEL